MFSDTKNSDSTILFEKVQFSSCDSQEGADYLQVAPVKHYEYMKGRKDLRYYAQGYKK